MPCRRKGEVAQREQLNYTGYGFRLDLTYSRSLTAPLVPCLVSHHAHVLRVFNRSPLRHLQTCSDMFFVLCRFVFDFKVAKVRP